ncbi:hypothetical protein Tcan_13826 [Toxocara canis]|uniref:SXP/RAL-2 family protein Ani s 5-like cation-binding domain-containing protein n=1 Tax=Toxocara canis TaxID=6265 RepID=A0A0B2VIU5_TOXCA|nr:hypothetical protein Tcan_13826 [Toxocara canis]
MLAIAPLLFITLSVTPVLANKDAKNSLAVIGTSYAVWNVISPAFLQRADRAARTEFRQITSNASLTIAEAEEAIERWVSKQGGEVEVLYQQAISEMNRVRSGMKNEIQNSSIADETKTTLHQIMSVVQDRAQTIQQQESRIAAIGKSKPENIRNEIGSYFVKHLLGAMLAAEEDYAD